MGRAIFDVLPGLAGRLRFAALGDFPTPVDPLPRSAGIADGVGFVKRDDLSSSVYGGNKVRTLEVLFARALARGTETIYATGAFGSNHAVATALHAPRVGLRAGALLFPQPASWAALENLRVSAALSFELGALAHWSGLPYAMWRARRAAEVMAPGGATAWGALGYVSAALELASQIAEARLPAPGTVVVGVGSTCTSAGLLLGFQLAHRLGLGFVKAAPRLVSVRVTPWPITSRWRITGLARRTSFLLAELASDPSLKLGRGQLGKQLHVDGDYLGAGYGIPTAAGRAAMRDWSEAGLPPLDTTYSAKAAASFLACCRRGSGPVLFWSTKSSAPLPHVTPEQLEQAPRLVQDWMRRAERELDGELPVDYPRLG